MTVLGRFEKQPAETLDYEFDFRPWLADRADTIASVTVAAVSLPPGSAAMTVSNITQNAGVIRFFAAGGLDGVRYEVTCTITTAATPARVKQDELIINVRER